MHDNEYTDERAVGRRRLDSAPESADAAPASIDLPTQMGNREFTRHVAAPVQRDADRSQGAGPLDPDIESDIRGAQGGGRPLDDGVRGDMESHLGVDLSSVRVHADSRGDALSRSVQADAFTTGTDVFFRSGKFSPDSGDGRKLLAHELTHVVQQSSGSVPSESRVSHPDDAHEAEARSVADSVATASPAVSSGEGGGAGVQRQEMPEEEEDVGQLAVSRQEVPEEEEETMM